MTKTLIEQGSFVLGSNGSLGRKRLVDKPLILVRAVRHLEWLEVLLALFVWDILRPNVSRLLTLAVNFDELNTALLQLLSFIPVTIFDMAYFAGDIFCLVNSYGGRVVDADWNSRVPIMEGPVL